MSAKQSQPKSAEELLKEQLARMEHTWLGELKRQQRSKDKMRQDEFHQRVKALSPKHTVKSTAAQIASLKKIEQSRAKLDTELKHEITVHLEKQLQGRSFEKRIEDALRATPSPEFTPPGMTSPKPSMEYIEQKISQQMGMAALNNQNASYLDNVGKINQEIKSDDIEISREITRAFSQSNKVSLNLNNQKTENTNTQEKTGVEELREKLAREIKERENNERDNSKDDHSR